MGAHIAAIADVKDRPFPPVEITAETLQAVRERKPLAVMDEENMDSRLFLPEVRD